AFDGNEPRLEQNEKGECDLDLRALPMKCLLNIRNKEGPTVLQVGDHHHADHADDELSPTKQVARASRSRLRERVHGASPRPPSARVRYASLLGRYAVCQRAQHTSSGAYSQSRELGVEFRTRLACGRDLQWRRSCGVWYTRIQRAAVCQRV